MEGVPQYYLAYHGRNNRRVNQRIAELYRRATPSANFTAPFTRTYAPPAPGAPLRVGFISLYFRDHSVSKMVAGVLEVPARAPQRAASSISQPLDPPHTLPTVPPTRPLPYQRVRGRETLYTPSAGSLRCKFQGRLRQGREVSLFPLAGERAGR